MIPEYKYSATVLRVVDGDTLDLRVDCGFRVWMEDRFRLYGINAPEVYGEEKEKGLEAKHYLESVLPVGKPVIVETFKPKDKYGRWLGVIYADGDSVNDLMIVAGQAKPYFP